MQKYQHQNRESMDPGAKQGHGGGYEPVRSDPPATHRMVEGRHEMSELVLNIVGIACVFIVALVFAYRLGPGLGDAMSAWAKKQQDLTVHRLAEEYVKGFQDGAEREQRKGAGRS